MGLGLFFLCFVPCLVTHTHTHTPTISLSQTALTLSKQEQASSAVTGLTIIVVSLLVPLLTSCIPHCYSFIHAHSLSATSGQNSPTAAQFLLRVGEERRRLLGSSCSLSINLWHKLAAYTRSCVHISLFVWMWSCILTGAVTAVLKVMTFSLTKNKVVKRQRYLTGIHEFVDPH